MTLFISAAWFYTYGLTNLVICEPHISHFLKMFTLLGNYTFLKGYCLFLDYFLHITFYAKKDTVYRMYLFIFHICTLNKVFQKEKNKLNMKSTLFLIKDKQTVIGGEKGV